MTIITPLYLDKITGHITEVQAGDLLNTSNLPYSGLQTINTRYADLNFGALPGSNEASVVVSGLEGIVVGSAVNVWFSASDTTLTHTANDHKYAPDLIALTASSPIAGDGFTIYATSLEKLTGTYRVRYSWLNNSDTSLLIAPRSLNYSNVRPSDWLTLPTLATTDQKFVGLFAVTDTSGNYIALSATGDYTVDWGDGTSANFSSGAVAEKQYSWSSINSSTTTSGGFRQVLITVTPQAGQTLTSLNLNNIHSALSPKTDINTPYLDIAINSQSLTTLSFPTINSSFANLIKFYLGKNSLSSLSFVKCDNLKIVDMPELPSYVNFSDMFSNCAHLQYVLRLDTSSGTNFSNLFGGCALLQSIPALNTALGTNFSFMFISCKSLQSIPVLNTSSGTNFSYMLYGCTALQSASFSNTSSGTIFSYMLYGCTALQSASFSNTSSGTIFSYMLYGCTALQSASFSNTSSGTNFSFMFTSCKSLQSIPALNTALGTDFSFMFANCTALRSASFSNTSSGTDFVNMFSNCTALQSASFSNTSSGTNFANMFAGCTALQSIPLLNMSSGTNFSDMFYGCTALQSIPLLNTSSGTDFTDMFYGCTSLQSVPVLNTSSGTDFTNMFYGCTSLQSVPVLNTSSGTNFSFMFYGCSSLQTIPLLNTSSGTDFPYMFYGCTSLQSLPAINMSNATTASTFVTLCFSILKISFSGLRYTVDVSNNSLSASAINDTFTSLGTAAGAQTITVTGNPGAATCTPSIATSKGWTVVQ